MLFVSTWAGPRRGGLAPLPPTALADVRKATRPPYEVFHRIADKHAIGVRELVLRAVAVAKGKTVLAAVERALDLGDVEGAIAAIPWDAQAVEIMQAALPALVRDTLEESAAAAVDQLQRSAPRVAFNLRFDITNQRAIDWIRSHAAELVREVSAEAKRAVRLVIERSFELGITARDAARTIRDIVGLTAREALAVQNFRTRQALDGVPQQKALLRTERYAGRLLRVRGERIARTETIDASTRGQVLLWEQARDRGLVGAQAVMEWVVTPDDRLCPLCQQLDGAHAPIGGTFAGGVPGPPLHPNCRCAVVLRPDGPRGRR